MRNLSKVSIQDAKKIVGDDVTNSLKENEPIYQVDNFDVSQDSDELVDIEIALRKCERTGFFDKE